MTETLIAVADAIRRRFGLNITPSVEYPGFLSIPEFILNDSTDLSNAAWAVGPGELAGSWTGQLVTEEGAQADPSMTFCVWPVSDSPDDIADAVYAHGIGDLYVGGGCANCPVRRP